MQSISKVIPKLFSYDIVIRNSSISNKNIYNDLHELFNNLRKKSLLTNELNDKLVQHIIQCDRSISGNGRTMIEPYYNDLIQLNQKNNYLNKYDNDQIQLLSINLLQTMKYQKYSIVELLIKLKMIFSDLLKDPQNVDEITEEWFSTPSSEHDQLLNELMNAPLDDIRIFLEEHGKTFETYFTTEILDELVHRISNNIYNSKDFLDKLCNFLKNTMTNKYSPLTAIDLIIYIQDQYYSEEKFKYRRLLQKFDEVEPKIFTLENFYQTVKINPVFTANIEQSFEKLFRNYCKKYLKSFPTESISIEKHNTKQTTTQTRFNETNYSRYQHIYGMSH